MWLYYCLIAYIYISSIFIYRRPLLYQERRINRDKLFLFLSMGLLLLLNCLRSLYTGNDTLSYYKLFKYYSTGSTVEEYSTAGYIWMDSYVDVGWRYLNRIFSHFSDNYQLFISLVAIFLYSFTTKHIRKYSPYIGVSILLFFLRFYHPYLNVLRQAVSIVIILMAHQLLIKRKYVKYAICILLAALFHKFAIVAFILVFFDRIQYKKTTARWMIVVSIILSISGGALIVPRLIGYSGSYMTNETGISTFFSFVLNASIFFIMNYISSKGMCCDKQNDKNVEKTISYYKWINLVSLCLSILEMTLPGLYRVEYFFTIHHIVGIPYMLKYSKISDNTKRNSLLLIIASLIIYQTGIFIFRPEWISEFPYHFYWQVN